MALSSPAQLSQDQVGILRLLAQSPAWALLSSHLQRQVRLKEAEKASHLRKGDSHKATLSQGYIDGLTDALGRLDNLISPVNLAPEDQTPVY